MIVISTIHLQLVVHYSDVIIYAMCLTEECVEDSY